MIDCPDCHVLMVGVDIFETPIRCCDCGRMGKQITAIHECPNCHEIIAISVPIWPESEPVHNVG